MEQTYNKQMRELGYNQLVCDIFIDWENVKDEILLKERKEGTGNGTVHVFLGAGDAALREEFGSYYYKVENGEDPSVSAYSIRHYFLKNNVLSMIGYLCQYCLSHEIDFSKEVESIIAELDNTTGNNGLLTTTSLFKLSTGSNKLRPYFKQFDENGVFYRVIRHLLLPNSAYKISLYKNNKGEYAAFWLIGFDYISDFDANPSKSFIKQDFEKRQGPFQQIFYGAPGTGKSHEVKKLTGEWISEDKDQDLPNVFRITIHPDTDYASFVGCYKPTMKPTSKEEKTLTGKDEEIVYEFVPQAFTDAYIYAYTHLTEQTFLVIEEINRGNCAQIFGDLFQLLDRKGGVSEYKIKADKDLANYLIEKLGVDSEGIKDGKLSLPANLNILATMNTSDQSLFPMDSAFKRRWEWEYVPINYGTDIKSGTFEITIGKKVYPWVGFIEQVNKSIFNLTQSEDKQLGNFFIKHSVDEKEFKSKVMFYLWYEVLRDETENNKYFFYKKTTIDGKEELGKFIFIDLYEEYATQTLQQFMVYLGVDPK